MATSKEIIKKRKRRRKRRRNILLLLLLATAAVCFCLFAPFFNLTEIAVSGNEKVAVDAIISHSLVAEGTNIFRINTKNAEAGIRQLPYVDTVRVKRKLPSKLQITVTESVPKYLAAFGEQYLLLDHAGKVLELLDDPSAYDLPLITGLDIKKAEPASKIGLDDAEKFDIIINNSKMLEDAQILSDVREINGADILNFEITLKSGLRVTFGKSDNMEYKMKLFREVLPQVDQTEGAYLNLLSDRAFFGKDEATPSPSPSASPEGTDTAGDSASPQPTSQPDDTTSAQDEKQ